MSLHEVGHRGDCPTGGEQCPELAAGLCFWCDSKEVMWPVIPGPLKGIDGPLEWLKGVTVWTVLAFFVIASLVITIVANIIVPPIYRIVTFNPEEWRRPLGTLRTWSLILGVLWLLFLVS